MFDCLLTQTMIMYKVDESDDLVNAGTFLMM